MEATRPLADYCRRTLRLRGSDLGAVLAMAVALDPSVVAEETRVRVDVESRGELTRGAVVLDPVGLSRRAANARLVRGTDAERARALLFDTLKAGVAPAGEARGTDDADDVAEPESPAAVAPGVEFRPGGGDASSADDEPPEMSRRPASEVSPPEESERDRDPLAAAPAPAPSAVPHGADGVEESPTNETGAAERASNPAVVGDALEEPERSDVAPAVTDS
jgi:hypothetical protein